MKYKTLIISAFALLALSAGTCASSTDEPGSTSPTGSVCTEQGGRTVTGPESRTPTCVLPTKDAGKSCSSSADCTSYCLADTNTCAPTNPYFGCFEERFVDGNSATLCVE